MRVVPVKLIVIPAAIVRLLQTIGPESDWFAVILKSGGRVSGIGTQLIFLHPFVAPV
jgi:hypothetical protein